MVHVAELFLGDSDYSILAMSGKYRGKKNAGRNIKLPEGATSLNKYCDKLQGVVTVEEKVVQFVNNLAESHWEPYSARPKSEVFGFYFICRWYPREKSWVILYAGRGHIRACLDQHFSRHERTPISNYLSSFPKSSRSLLWLKWAKDPFYPYEGMRLQDVLTVLSKLYSSNEECPPFNMDLDDKSEKLPENFSIIPDWNKPQRKKIEVAES